MTGKRAATLMISGLIVVGCVMAQSAHGQIAYPEKLIKMIVPAPAGGQTDVMARLVARGLAAGIRQLPCS